MDPAVKKTPTKTAAAKAAPNRLLRQAREEKCFSQEDLAERLGTTQVTISRWERGLMTPSLYYRRKLRAFFGKSLAALGLAPPADRPLRQRAAPASNGRPPGGPTGCQQPHCPFR